MTELRNQYYQARLEQYDEMLHELAPLMGKCFRQEVNGGWRYTVITGYPPLETTRTDVHFNAYQIPAISFYLAPEGKMMPFAFDSDRHCENVFFFEPVFTGSLPKEYHFGATPVREAEYEEITFEDFNTALNERFVEFKKKIYEVHGDT